MFEEEVWGFVCLGLWGGRGFGCQGTGARGVASSLRRSTVKVSKPQPGSTMSQCQGSCLHAVYDAQQSKS